MPFHSSSVTPFIYQGQLKFADPSLCLLLQLSFLFLLLFPSEPRPSVQHTVHLVKHGMPSSHAQFIWFFSAYFVLFVAYRVVEDSHKWWKPVMSAGVTALALVVTYSRVYLGYHTTAQGTGRVAILR